MDSACGLEGSLELQDTAFGRTLANYDYSDGPRVSVPLCSATTAGGSPRAALMALCTSGFRRFALVDVRRSAILQPKFNPCYNPEAWTNTL